MNAVAMFVASPRHRHRIAIASPLRGEARQLGWRTNSTVMRVMLGVTILGWID